MGTTRRKVALSASDMRVIMGALKGEIAELDAAVPRSDKDRSNQQYLLRERAELVTLLEDELAKLELQQAKERQQTVREALRTGQELHV